MTKRAVIITSSIILGIIAILTTLFGVVFRVRQIDVDASSEFNKYHVIDVSGLSKGGSIFGVDRDKVVSNIEREFPYARVRVNLTGFTSVKITLTARKPLYYLVHEGAYYILDEQCKVLEITHNPDSAVQYVLLNNVFEITENTYAGEFLSNKYTQVCEDLYTSLCIKWGLQDEGGELIEREDMCQIIDSIKFVQVNEFKGRVDKMIISTSYGTTISIIDPQQNIDLKVNMAFSALNALIARGKGEETSGEISVRYSYDENNNYQPKCEYISGN